ncbi:potassium channel AKT1-like [Bombyx mandarina]|uniref:Potassium channel AKT1-like n=1 Tax=Bombyx mandarina TaxID=7092 RepID=A0A6J2JMF3_BOMMA|nr:potassium channel AKT1-like [Bombyx mandarina]
MKLRIALEFLHRDNEFLIAAELGDDILLDKYIKQGENIQQMDHLGRNALHLAVCSDNEHAITLLLDAGVNPNHKDNVGMTPLSLSLMKSPSLKIAMLLFDHGAKILPRVEPTDTGLFLQFLMMCEPSEEDEKIIRLMIEKGALVNDPEAPGRRQALHFAAMSNNCKLIKLLLNLGADLSLTNHRDETPKEVANTFGCKEALQCLKELDCDFVRECLDTLNEIDEIS